MSKVHWLALSNVRGIGGVTFRRLLGRFGSVEAVLAAPPEELLRVPLVTEKVLHRLRAISLDALAVELVGLNQQGLQVVTWEDAAYPANLRSIADAPPVLFVRGSLSSDNTRAVAMVGTRQPSPEKEALARDLARELAQRGLTIVSGLALGIDTAAHQGALQAETGCTLAVPGSGLQALHPPENIPLAETIARRGALLSELRPDTAVRGSVLMARNRILGGLSRAVIVVEAGQHSGSLDTARKAHRQGRPLFAVSGSPGTHVLLALGAERLDPGAQSLRTLCERVVTLVEQDRPLLKRAPLTSR
jgi:DNA processing protein